MKSTHFFLGANSAEGFYSLYDQLLDAELDDLLILKGGPGCGKSTFMRRIAGALEKAGADTVYIHCSGDPHSLDGVIFPSIRTALVDGTAPHVLEPRYMAARERYVDLSPFYDINGAKTRCAALVEQADAYRVCYREAYHALRALGGIDAERRMIAQKGIDGEKLMHRAMGIAARELRGGRKGEKGRERKAFLGGITHEGVICRFDSVDALCPRVYEICDRCGLAAPVLQMLRETALTAGEDAIVCPDPNRPSVVQHLLLPSRGVAFITTGEELCYTGNPYRRLRVDAMADAALTRAQKARLRFLRRIRRALEEEAVAALSGAKQEHDALEALYRPLIRFEGVEALCGQETERLLGRFACTVS